MRNTKVALFSTICAALGGAHACAALSTTNGLTFWLDANAIVGVSNGHALATWSDASGSGYDATQVAGPGQPTYFTNALGGMPAVSFNGGNTLQTGMLQGDWPTSNGTIFVVSRADNLTQSSSIFRSNPNEAVRLSAHLPWSNGNYFDFGNTTAGSGRLQWGNAGTDALHVWCLRSEGGVGKQAYRDGSLQIGDGTTATFPATNYSFLIGDAYQGDIGEMLIYNRALSPAEQNEVGTYLSSKYGVTTAYTSETIPASISGLELWLDAVSLLGLTNGESVSSWPDLSGNEKHATQASAAAQPAYVTNAIGGKPAVQFDGGARYLDGPGTTITAKTIFMVLKVDPTAVSLTGVFAQKGVDFWNIRSEGGQWNSPRNGNINAADFGYQGDIRINGEEASVHNSQAHILMEVDADTSSFQYRLSQTLNDRYFKGDLAEVLIYNRVLTPAEQATIGCYLEQKYALTSSYAAVGNADGATGVTTVSADLNGSLSGTDGGTSTVSVFWGPVDGTTNAAAWMNHETLGMASGPTDFTTNIMGLTAGTVYYYRFHASNATSSAWADASAVFETSFSDNTNGLSLWLDAGALTGMTNGQSVQNWADLSGNERHVYQDEEARRPVFRPAGLNGVASLDFDGAADRMMRNLVNLPAREIFVVAVTDSNSGFDNLISNGSDRENIRANNAGYVAGNANDFPTSGNLRQNNSVSLTKRIGQFVILHADAASLRNYPVFMIGDNGTHNRYWDGDIAEIIVYDRALSSSERMDIGMYLAQKYDLNSAYRRERLPGGVEDASLWFAADTIAGTDDGESVNTWYDISGNSRNGQQASANSGILHTNVLNGKPVVRFDGTNGHYFTFPLMTNIRAVFWVLQEDPDATGTRFLLGESDSDTYFHFHRGAGNSKTIWGGSTHTYVRSGVTTVDGTPVDGQSTRCPTNHALVAVRTAGDVRANNFVRDRIGINPQRTWHGDLAELIIYTRELSEGEHNRVGVYLAQKYSLDAFFTSVDNAAGATSIGTSVATLNGGLSDSAGGQATTVRVFWGEVDGGTNSAAWEHTNTFAAVTNSMGFATNITGLTPTTVYYYRFHASNAVVEAWADSTALFETRFNNLIPDMNLWLDASALTLSNGVAMPVWLDVSGSMDHLSQSESNRQPAYAVGGLNGLPAVDFDGINDRIFRNFPVVSAREIFAVTQVDGIVGWNNLISNAADKENIRANGGLYGVGSSPANFPIVDGLRLNNVVSTTLSAGKVDILHAEAPSLRNYPTFMVGDNGTHDRYWDGDVAEILVYDQLLNHGHRNAIGLYLSEKYGIASAYSMISNDEGATSIAPTSAILNGALGVDEAVVSVFWGTTDGGTNATAWTYTNALGTNVLGEMSMNATGLTAQTVYHYRYFATNANGAAWAPASAQFITRGTLAVANGLTLWFNAGATFAVSNGETVDLWPDQSGSGNDGANNGGNPVLRLNALAGRPVVTFDGGENTFFSWNRLDNIRTVFWVIREDADATFPRFLLGSEGIGDIYHFHRAPGASKAIWGNSAHANVTNGVTKLNGEVIDGLTTAVPTNEFGIISVRTTANTTANTFASDRHFSGGVTAVRTWDGELAELIIYNRALTDEEEHAIGLHLSLKYHIESDYIGHTGMLLLLR